MNGKTGSLPTFSVNAIYQDESYFWHQRVKVEFWDDVTVTKIIMLCVDYKKGKFKSSLVKLTLTDDCKEKLGKQGIPVSCLSHLVLNLKGLKTEKR